MCACGPSNSFHALERETFVLLSLPSFNVRLHVLHFLLLPVGQRRLKTHGAEPGEKEGGESFPESYTRTAGAAAARRERKNVLFGRREEGEQAKDRYTWAEREQGINM